MEKHCEPCKREGIQRMSTMFCEECKELYCASCGRKHRTYRICQTHNVVQLEASEMSHLKATMQSISFESVDSDDYDKPHLQKQHYENVVHKEASICSSKPSNYEDVHFDSNKEEENAYKALESAGENVPKETECSSDHSDTQNSFPVDLIQSPQNSKLRIPHGSYRLQLQQDGMILLERNTDFKVSYWPFAGIRKYGCQGYRFVIIAGRRCQSGEGEFVFSSFLSKVIKEKCMMLCKRNLDSKSK